MLSRQLYSFFLLTLFIYLNVSITLSWTNGIIPVFVTEEIKEMAGNEEESTKSAWPLEMIIHHSNENKPNFNFKFLCLQEFNDVIQLSGIFYKPDHYSPPEFI